MTALDTSPSMPIARQGGRDLLRFLFFGVTVAYVVGFATMLALHIWLWNSTGALVPLDFVDVYAAGKLVWAGHAADMYDWSLHRAAEAVVLGHPVSWKEYLGWHYPPPFLFAAVALATLPYVTAFLAWSVGTAIPYLLVMRRIVGHQGAWFAALAFPSTFFNIAVGQNGFVTAALMGGSLSLLQTSPVAAGALVGLLTYKPQLGILFPLALAAGGHWRAMASAAVTGLAMMLASALVFGAQSWAAFFHSITHTVRAVLMQGLAGWGKLNSLYGFCRWVGGSAAVAGTVQLTVCAGLAGAIMLLWRSQASIHLKAAALVIAALLATPYLYVYDMSALAIALAFLYRDRTFEPAELVALGIALLALAAFPLVAAPTGLIAMGMTMALVARRVMANRHAC